MINKYDLSEFDYKSIVDNQHANKKVFKEQTHGSRKKLFVYNQLIASHVQSTAVDVGHITRQQFASFLGTFSRGLYKTIVNNEDLLNLHIQFKGFSRNKNHQLWTALPVNQLFYNIDLSSAYWQIAFRLGYITEKHFIKYLSDDRYKSAKRLCISFLARPNKMVYHRPDGQVTTIHCDMTPLKQVYNNIRNELYTVIQSISETTEYLEYNIDGITVLPVDLKKVSDYFHSLNLKYKTTICCKLNESSYSYGSKQMTFKRKLNKH